MRVKSHFQLQGIRGGGIQVVQPCFGLRYPIFPRLGSNCRPVTTPAVTGLPSCALSFVHG